MSRRIETPTSMMLVMFLLLALLPTSSENAEAAVPVPHNLYGQARDSNGVELINGSFVSSWIDGVMYGWNMTFYEGSSPDPSNRSSRFDVDTAGNHITIPGDPDTPWVKEGGTEDVDDIMYVWGDMTGLDVSPGNATTIFEQTVVWRASVSEHMNLSEAIIQPPALPKINNIILLPPDAGTQYTYIFGPEGTPMDEFYLEKNDGQLHSPATRINLTGTISETRYFYVDLGATDYLDINGDELKLVWENPGGLGAPFAGMDLVVDRVEFNNTIGGTHYGEPDNTIMPDAVVIPTGIRRIIAGTDTNDCFVDFAAGTIGRSPNAPYPLSVEGRMAQPNETIGKIANRIDPFLEFNHADPGMDPQFGYHIQVANDSAFTDIRWESYQPTSPAAGENYGGLVLDPGECYYYRARTKDAYDYGPWANTTICMNSPPSVPSNIWPHNETVWPPWDISVCWDLSIDPDMDTVSYQVQISENVFFFTIYYEEFTDSGCSTPMDYFLFTRYYWRVRAYDGYEYSRWSNESAPWYFDTASPPMPPEVWFPAVEWFYDGTLEILHIVNRENPRLNWTFFHGESPFVLQKVFEVEIGTLPGQGNGTIWTVSGGPEEEVYYNGSELGQCTDYYFRVRVQDDSSWHLWSDWRELMFHTNCMPTIPTPALPVNGSVLPPSGVVFMFTTSTDGDLDLITYTLQISDNPEFDPPLYEIRIQSTQWIGPEFASGQCYYWRVNASDGWESSPWSQVMTFCVDNFPGPPVGLAVEGFMSGPGLMHILVGEPSFNWTFVDPDAGDVQTEFDLEVWTDTGGAGTQMWAYSQVTAHMRVDYDVDTTAAVLIQGEPYYVRVRTKDAHLWSGWSELQFELSAPPPTPLLTSPTNGAMDVSITPDLSWQQVIDANGDSVFYRWFLDTDSIPIPPYVDNGSTPEPSISAGMPLSYETYYYWVVCSDDLWESPQCSATWSFRTEPPPNNPPHPPASLLVDGYSSSPEIVHLLNHLPTLKWTFTDPDDDTQGAFHVQIWKSAPETGALVWDSSQTSSLSAVTYGGTDLIDGQDYWFRVKTGDESGLWSNWSAVMFRMNAVPSIPELASPANGSIDIVPGSIQLDWIATVDPDGDSVTYFWYLSTQPDFSVLIDSGFTSNTSVNVTTLPQTTYYWQIEATDDYESSENSTLFVFTTGASPDERGFDWFPVIIALIASVIIVALLLLLIGRRKPPEETDIDE